jgi:hypothetical protein
MKDNFDFNYSKPLMFYFHAYKLHGSFGWFIGEPFRLFHISIGEVLELNDWSLFELQITKFQICLNWY